MTDPHYATPEAAERRRAYCRDHMRKRRALERQGLLGIVPVAPPALRAKRAEAWVKRERKPKPLPVTGSGRSPWRKDGRKSQAYVLHLPSPDYSFTGKALCGMVPRPDRMVSHNGTSIYGFDYRLLEASEEEWIARNTSPADLDRMRKGKSPLCALCRKSVQSAGRRAERVVRDQPIPVLLDPRPDVLDVIRLFQWHEEQELDALPLYVRGAAPDPVPQHVELLEPSQSAKTRRGDFRYALGPDWTRTGRSKRTRHPYRTTAEAVFYGNELPDTDRLKGVTTIEVPPVSLAIDGHRYYRAPIGLTQRTIDGRVAYCYWPDDGGRWNGRDPRPAAVRALLTEE